MSISSRSDMDDTQVWPQSRPLNINPADEIYNMQVLHLDLGETEDDLDQHFLRTALNLGIEIPQDRQSAVELVTSDSTDTDLAIPSTPPKPHCAQSLASISTNPRSGRSSQDRISPTKASSLTTTSVLSSPPSVHSTSSSSSPYGKLRDGLRRLSTFKMRRKSSMAPPVIAAPAGATPVLEMHSNHRPVTANSATSFDIHSLPCESSEPSPLILQKERPVTIAVPYHAPIEEVESDEAIGARLRSIESWRLERLRTHQLEEQGRLVRFENEQYSLMTLKRPYKRKVIVDSHKEQQQNLLKTHAENLAALEHRHLAAEMELVGTLDTERKACDTRLKHMEAYCSGRPPPNGMPRRKITEKDGQKLLQQQHIRSGMDNLHEARIHILREIQATQLERITARQEAEISEAKRELERHLDDHEYQLGIEEQDLRQEFSDRKNRISARWTLIEAIERRKLENETGHLYAPLPAITWPADVPVEDDG